MPRQINQRLQDFLNQTFWVNSSHFGTIPVKVYGVRHDRSGRIDVLVNYHGTHWWAEGWELFDTKEEALVAKKKALVAKKKAREDLEAKLKAVEERAKERRAKAKESTK